MDPFTVALVMGAIGGTIGGFNSMFGNQDKLKNYNEQKKYLDDLYKAEQEYYQKQFDTEKEQANDKALGWERQADMTDAAQDLNEGMLSADYNNTVEGLNAEQKSNVFDWNTELMAIENAYSNSLAKNAASGIRAGSSLDQAVDLEKAVNNAALQNKEDIARAQFKTQLQGLDNNLAQGKFNIWTNRENADWQRDDAAKLRNSYLEGGSQYELFKQQQGIRDLQYKNTRNNLNKEIDHIEKWGWVDSLTSFFTWGSQSAATTANYVESYNNWKKPAISK